MNDWTDQQLLREFAERRAESAFAELVHRHVDLVYSAALRLVCDAHLAQDVTQGVFVALAQNAPQLASHPVLSGWLHCTARNLAAKSVRSAARRRAREQEAAAMNELLANESNVPWEQIAPHLDAALGELSDADRDAVMLRYLEKKSAQEMAAILGVSAEAAQKRVSRAVERLREAFARRGVAAGAGGLVILISTNAVQSAPVGLAAAISTAALAGAAVSTSAAIVATKTIAMTVLQKTVAAVTAVALAGVGIYEARQASTWQARAQKLEAPPPSAAANDEALLALRAQIRALTNQNALLTGAFDKVNAEKSQLEKELEQARHSAALFRELASHSQGDESAPTNNFPTERHVFVEMGRNFREIAQFNSQKTDELSAAEKAANDTAGLNLGLEAINLIKALHQFDSASSAADKETQRPDFGACLLYGALDLNDQQFSQVCNVLQKYQDQAVQQKLFSDDTSSETVAALKQLDDQVKSELSALLAPEQAAILAQMSPGLNFITGSFNFNVNLRDQSKTDAK